MRFGIRKRRQNVSGYLSEFWSLRGGVEGLKRKTLNGVNEAIFERIYFIG